MLRFLVALALLAIAAFAVIKALGEVRNWAMSDGENGTQTTGRTMQKVSFVLLLLLIVYVSIVGAG